MSAFNVFLSIALVSIALVGAATSAYSGLGPSDLHYWPSTDSLSTSGSMGATASIDESISLFKTPCRYRGGSKVPRNCVK